MSCQNKVIAQLTELSCYLLGMTIIYSCQCQRGSPSEHTATLGALQWVISALTDLLIFTFPGKHGIPCLRKMNATDKEFCFYSYRGLLFYSRCLLVPWFNSLMPFSETSNSPSCWSQTWGDHYQNCHYGDSAKKKKDIILASTTKLLPFKWKNCLSLLKEHAKLDCSF